MIWGRGRLARSGSNAGTGETPAPPGLLRANVFSGDERGDTMRADATATPDRRGGPAWPETEDVVAVGLSPTRRALRRFMAHRPALVSLVALAVLLLLAAGAPLLPLHNPTTPDANLVADGPPTGHNWLGTDGAGLDVFSRLVYGMRPTFVVGIVGQVITTLIGVALGVTGGYYGGWVDAALTRLTDLAFAFPSLLLAFLVVKLFGDAWTGVAGGAGLALLITVAFALVGWPGLMRFTRGQTLSLREQEFVEAARALGVPERRVIARHILPNIWGLVLVQATFGVGAYIGGEAVLSALGLGVQKPTADLGVMVQEGMAQLSANAVEAIAPSVLLTVITVAIAFVGDGLRDALDP